MNLREIKELGLNQVFTKKKNLFNKPKLVCMAIKDNSIILLESVFDLNFDEIFFLENHIKIVQNKDKFFLEFNSIMDSKILSPHHQLFK